MTHLPGGVVEELQSLLWLCTAAYTIHAAEEFMLDWRGWATWYATG